MRRPGSPTLALSMRATPFCIGRALFERAAHLGRQAELCPLCLGGASGRILPVLALSRHELCGSLFAPGRVSKALLGQHLLWAGTARACAQPASSLRYYAIG